MGGFWGTRMVMEAVKKSESSGGSVDKGAVIKLTRKPNAKKLLRILRTEVFLKTCAEQMHPKPSGAGTDGAGDQ
uniref:Uncharacterized protein MANES_11G080000 n=1 Tax=Rhizophora mucronata TaxID=61149 RepID=A0A2P2QSR8_RHIMU